MYLRRVEVLDAASHATVFTLADSALIRALARVAPPTCRATDTTSRPAVECLPASERAQIPAGVRAYVYLWIPVDANRPPATLRHRLTFKRTGADSSDVVLEGTHDSRRDRSRGHLARRFTESGRRSTARRTRRDIDASCSDSTDTRPSANGSRSISCSSIRPAARTTAIRSRTRTTTRTARQLMAVADGVIAATKDSIPQNVPGAASRAVPITMTTVGGNYVAIDIGRGRYALYAHVQPGSLRVKVGDRVKRGQVIALLGNSGNSTEPHVHFQIADGPTFLSSEGIPYAMNFDVIGQLRRLGEQRTGRHQVLTPAPSP